MSETGVRMVTAEEARKVVDGYERFVRPDANELRTLALARTVVAQDEQIAAVLALCEEYGRKLEIMDPTTFGIRAVQADTAAKIARALGVNR